jgi:hypothetical protein
MTQSSSDARRLARAVCLVALAVAATAAVSPSAASALVGTSKYPDIRALPPTGLMLADQTVNSEQHRVMYFAPHTYNRGPGALEIQRVPRSSGIADLKQRIYESPAGFHDEQLAMVAIDSPLGFVIPAIQRYEVWSQRAFQRATAHKFRRGKPLFVTEDVSQCLEDSEPVDHSTLGVDQPFYTCTSGVIVGISPGWADVEAAWDPHMIDFGTTALPDGNYVLRAIVDPHNLIWESAGKSDPAKESWVANQGITTFEIINGALAWQDP